MEVSDFDLIVDLHSSEVYAKRALKTSVDKMLVVLKVLLFPLITK